MAVRENLRDEDPDDRALREGKERDVTHQQPDKKILVALYREDVRHTSQRCRSSHGAGQQKNLAPEFVDD